MNILFREKFLAWGVGILISQVLFGPGFVGVGAAKASWEEEWEKTVAAAKKEGRVVLVTNRGFSPYFAEFEKKYPEIKVVEGTVGSVNHRTRILLTERRAGKFLKDVSIGQPDQTQIRIFVEKGILDPIPSNLILPEVTDRSRWWGKQHHYIDAEGKYLFIFEGTVRAADIAYNTELINPHKIKSYWDILQAKWKGKIVVPDPRNPRVRGISGSGLLLFYHHPALGPKYIKRLFSEMDVTLSRDYTQMMNWLALKRFSFYFFSRSVDDAVRQGLPVNKFSPAHFKEGGVITPIKGVIARVNRAPHPNAAKVFINWVLSREGQIAFQKISTANNRSTGNSMRDDIPKDVIPPEYHRVPGRIQVKALSGDEIDTRGIIKLVNSILVNRRK